jgi:RNA recognition motif-containing protein
MSAVPPVSGAVCSEPKVFVGQLPPEATQQDVVGLFEKYGAIKSCGIIGTASAPRCAMVRRQCARRGVPHAMRGPSRSRGN